jgi:hypothetical protein
MGRGFIPLAKRAFQYLVQKVQGAFQYLVQKVLELHPTPTPPPPPRRSMTDAEWAEHTRKFNARIAEIDRTIEQSREFRRVHNIS